MFKLFKVLREFAVHVLVNSAIFVIIALFAIGLNFAIRWLEGMKISNIILYGLIGTEYSVFAMDILLYIIFLTTNAKNLVTNIKIMMK